MGYLNGIFVATRDYKEYFTKGHYYEFIDGSICYDTGDHDRRIYMSIERFENENPQFRGILTVLTQPKDLLIIGRIVKHRNGLMGFVLSESIIYSDGINRLSDFNHSLESKRLTESDIIEIYEATERSCFYKKGIICLGNLIWKREELTPEQIEINAIEQEMLILSDQQKKLAERITQLKK